MSTKKWMRDVSHLLDEMGIEHSIEFGSKHAKLRIWKGGKKGTLTVSVSPSDRLTLLNIKRDAKRQVA